MAVQKEAIPTLTGYAYARYSSHSQREESIEQQLDEIRSFAEEQGIQIIEVFADAALTGRNDRRPQFQRMMRMAKKQHPGVIIAYKSNRISRNMLNALSTENELEKIGVKVLYVKETFGDNAAGRFALRTMMNVNQFYSENMAEDIKRGLMDNAENCIVNNGSMAYGYTKGPDGRYAIVEHEAIIVKEIYAKVAAGIGYAEIAATLNARGIKTKPGGMWNKNSFRRMLSNEIYKGVYAYASVRKEGGTPVIIPKEEWEAMQNILKWKKANKGSRRSDSEYMLTGKLFCGHCGSMMVGVSGTSHTAAKYRYYYCGGKLRGDCSKDNVRQDYIEKLVVEETMSRVLRDDVIEAIADMVIAYQTEIKNNNGILQALESNLKEVDKAISNMLKAIETGIITESTKNRLRDLESEKAVLKTGIAQQKRDYLDVTKDQIIFWLEHFRGGDIADRKYQKTIIDHFVNAIYLYDDEIRIFYNYTKNQEPISVARENQGTVDSSNEFRLSPPYQSHKNLPPGVHFIAGVVVLVLSLEKRKRK